MKNRRNGLILGFGLIVIFATGCTQGAPTVTLAESLPEITELSVTEVVQSNFNNYNFTLSGKAANYLTTFEVSPDGEEWTPVNSYGAQVAVNAASDQCTGMVCPFTFSISSIGSRIARIGQLRHNEETMLWVRGQSPFGPTPPVKVKFRKKVGLVASGRVSVFGIHQAVAGSGSLSVRRSTVSITPFVTGGSMSNAYKVDAFRKVGIE